MRRDPKWCLLALVATLCTSPAFAGGNVNFAFGSRSLDEDFWSPTDSQDVFGVTVDFGEKNWPIDLAVGYYKSSDEADVFDFILGSGSVKGSVSEISFGVLKTWAPGRAVRPFMGGGATFVEAKGEASFPGFGSAEDSDNSPGLYVEGGVYWRLASRLNIGVHARLVAGTDVDLFSVNGDADYGQFGFLIGWGWPPSK